MMRKRRWRPVAAAVASASALAISALLRRGGDDASDRRDRRSLRRRERRAASYAGDPAMLYDPSQIMPVQIMGDPDLDEPPLIVTMPTPGDVPLGDQVVDPVRTVMATVPFVPQVPHGDPVEEFYETVTAANGIEVSEPFPPLPHTDPVDEFFPPPHTDPVDEFFPPPHTDPVDEFADPSPPPGLPCQDDPAFRYDYKDKSVTCASLWLDRQARVICRTLLDDGVSIGVGHCPATCLMVNECLAREAALSGGAGGATAAPEPAMDGGDGTELTKRPHWWAVEDENGRKTHCVYNSDYPISSKEQLHASEYRCQQTLDEALWDEFTADEATVTEINSNNARTDPTLDTSDTTAATSESSSKNDPTDIMSDASNATAATPPSTLSTSATMVTTVVTNENTTVATTTTTRAEYWWPVEPADGTQNTLCVRSAAYPHDYLDDAVRSFVLFDTEEECCIVYHNCRAPAPEVRWYPDMVDDVPTCRNDAEYPPEYTENSYFAESFLFGTRIGCCDAFPSACVGLFWYPSSPGDAAGECEYGDDFPESMKGDDEYLFFTEGECCARWCGGEELAGVTATDATTTAAPVTTAAGASSSTTAEPVTTTTTNIDSRDPCTDCTWHESITQFRTCTNSPSYPPAWDHPYARAYFFFRTAEECCAARFPGSCTIDSIHAAGGASSGGDYGDGDEEYMPLGPRTIDDFEGDVRGLPFDFGAPAQWAFDDTLSHSGTRSVSNIPSTELGAAADLTLKISVSQPSTLSCWGMIDISMPYEIFYLMVNGAKRNTYHKPDTTPGVWTKFLTGLFPGNNEVLFRVENADVLWIPGERAVHFGTGRVWLDACEVNPS